ncbi:MAG: IclR family transcriptional regulator [Bacillus sp. (in: firmicutes)]
MSSKQTTHRLSTVDNAISLLTMFLKYESIGLMDIERETGVSKTAAFRLTATMADRGFLVKDTKTKRYYPGPILFQLVRKYQVTDIVAISNPFVQELARITNESVYVSIRSGNSYMFLTGINSIYPVKVTIPFGDEMPIHLGAAGKIHMAYMPTADIDHYLKRNELHFHVPNPLSDPQQLRIELAKVKEHGYATSFGDSFPDSAAITAPIWGLGEEPAASLGVFLPMSRITPEKQQELIDLVVTYAKKISKEYMAKKEATTE